MTRRHIISYSIIAFLVIVSLSMIGRMWENVGQGEIVVVQSPVSGKLTVYTSGGLRWQGWGKVTHYKKSFQYSFEKEKNADGSIKVRFNDGGHASLSGSIRVDLPLDDKSVILLHTKYGSQDAVERQLVKQVVDKSIYMTGPMMSSEESYAKKRNDLLFYIEDQAINGVYKTYVTTVRQKDPMDTTSEKTVSIVQIRMDEKGISQRQDVSPTSSYNIRLYGLAINNIDYDDAVEKQISSQQQATMQVQTA